MYLVAFGPSRDREHGEGPRARCVCRPKETSPAYLLGRSTSFVSKGWPTLKQSNSLDNQLLGVVWRMAGPLWKGGGLRG